MIYAYGICEPATAAPAARRRRGLGGAALRAIQSEGVAAVYSRHRLLRPRPVPEMVLDHERVVEEIMAGGAVLPLRFGTRLAGEEQLAAVLAERRDELLTSLARVRGGAELGVRVLPGSPFPAPPAVETTGRDYLLARVREQRCHEEWTREVHEPLAALSRASLVRRPPARVALLVGAYLVDVERIDELRELAGRLARRWPAVRIHVTGPWPPYSFAAGE